MPVLELKATHKAVRNYYEALQRFDRLGVKHEGAVRSAFQRLLEHCGHRFEWTLVAEWRIRRVGKHPLHADGALIDQYGLNHGLWEAKDTDDDLGTEIKAKFAAGYPRDNILFQEPRRAVLYQQSQNVFEADLTRPDDLVHVLKLFLEYSPPAIAQWEDAVEEFKHKVPELGASLAGLIEEQRASNKQFISAFANFVDLCRTSLNPNLSEAAVEEMIIQHLLTERIFRKIFDVADFMQRNIIAQEIEGVVKALTSKAFSRDDFVKSLDHFYAAIEGAAATIHEFSEKQTFLNTVYERFFQGFSVKVADTHGIVYTPQPLVDFMVASVEHVLHTRFGKTLAEADVHILDPFTGTGNFIVNIIRRLPKTSLVQKYRQELHCNEVMLLPYYVASMNIEHAYYEATAQYAPFEGICLVDTFQTAETPQGEFSWFNEQNSQRVKRQKEASIRVVIANPPYNAGQINENDNNKNRKYPRLDRHVSEVYGSSSTATLRRKLRDPYVKAIWYAGERIGESGIVCFVNNSSFVTERTFDGMRKQLVKDFDLVYVLDLGGNVRKHPDLSGTTHNVFGIQVGVSINLLVRLPRAKPKTGNIPRSAVVHYYSVPVDWRREQKYAFLEKKVDLAQVKWHKLKPDKKGNWLKNARDEEFGGFVALGSKGPKTGLTLPAIFQTYSLGVSTNRDAVVYDFDAGRLGKRVEQFAEDYNTELRRWQAQDKADDDDVDNFVSYEKVKWSETLKRFLMDGESAVFDADRIRKSLYRPFTEMRVYYASLFVDRPGLFSEIFPNEDAAGENRLIIVPSAGGRSPFWCSCTNLIPNLNYVSIDSGQCFPLYTYSEDGKERRENVTDSALKCFQRHYGDSSITGPEVFDFCYAILHHPAYRQRYAESLKRELARIPFITAGLASPPLASCEGTDDPRTARGRKADLAMFRTFVSAGQRLAELHTTYEKQKEYPLERVENRDVPLDWRVERIRLTKDRCSIRYNGFLTLTGIPPEVFEYRLGNRSGLEWVIDQYRVTRDQHGSIVRDPNRPEDEQHIVRLIGRVITVSIETLKVVNALPELKFE